MAESFAVAVLESSAPSQTFRPWLADDERVAVVSWDRFADIPGWADYLRADHVVIASRADFGVQARLVATTLAGSRQEVAVASRVLPTTAVALAASALTAIELGDTPAATLAIFDQLISQSLSGARLDRVSRLESPKPGLGMHVRSIFSKGYVALTSPTPGVSRVLSEAPEKSPILVAAELDSPEFDACVRMAGPHLAVQSVPAIVDTRRVYGSRGAEFVALAPAPAVDLGSGAQCPVCGAAQASPNCSFCHVHLRLPEPV